MKVKAGEYFEPISYKGGIMKCTEDSDGPYIKGVVLRGVDDWFRKVGKDYTDFQVSEFRKLSAIEGIEFELSQAKEKVEELEKRLHEAKPTVPAVGQLYQHIDGWEAVVIVQCGFPPKYRLLIMNGSHPFQIYSSESLFGEMEHKFTYVGMAKELSSVGE